MNDTNETVDRGRLASWIALVLRGILAVAFGVTALTSTRMPLMILAVVFAAYATIDGILTFGAALRARKARLPRWPLFLEAVVSIVAGEAALAVAVGVGANSVAFSEARVAFALVLLIASRALALGVTQLTDTALGKPPPDSDRPRAWSRLMNAAGIASIALGAVLFVGSVRTSTAPLIVLIGAYHAILGLVLVATGFAVKQTTHRLHERLHERAG